MTKEKELWYNIIKGDGFMISKELFISVIDKIQKQQKKVEEFNDALDKICDGWPVYDTDNEYLNALLDVLNEEFHDEGDTIGWWLWESSEKKIGVPNDEGKIVWYQIESKEQLYDYLVGNYKELSIVEVEDNV